MIILHFTLNTNESPGMWEATQDAPETGETININVILEEHHIFCIYLPKYILHRGMASS